MKLDPGFFHTAEDKTHWIITIFSYVEDCLFIDVHPGTTKSRETQIMRTAHGRLVDALQRDRSASIFKRHVRALRNRCDHLRWPAAVLTLVLGQRESRLAVQIEDIIFPLWQISEKLGSLCIPY